MTLSEAAPPTMTKNQLTPVEREKVQQWRMEAAELEQQGRHGEAFARLRQALTIDRDSQELADLVQQFAAKAKVQAASSPTAETPIALLESLAKERSGKFSSVERRSKLAAVCDRLTKQPQCVMGMLRDGAMLYLKELLERKEMPLEERTLLMDLWERILHALMDGGLLLHRALTEHLSASHRQLLTEDLDLAADILQPLVLSSNVHEGKMAVRIACFLAKLNNTQITRLHHLLAICILSDSSTFRKTCWLQILSILPDANMAKFLLERHVLDYLLRFHSTTDSASTLLPSILAKLWDSCQQGGSDDQQYFKNWCVLVFDKLFDAEAVRTVALEFLNTCFQIERELGAQILCKEGTLANMIDCLEYETSALQCATVEAWSTGCADKAVRGMISSECTGYLTLTLQTTKDELLKNTVAVVLTKLATAEHDLSLAQSSDLTATFVALIKNTAVSKDSSALRSAVEGLAYLSLNGDMKETIAKDASLLSRLLEFCKESSNPLVLGALMTLDNLSSYKKIASDEEEQVRKLREFAKDIPKNQDNVHDGDVYVEKRLDVLLAAGVVKVLAPLAKLESKNIRASLASILNNCASRTKTRGLMVQQGAVRACLTIIAASPAAAASETVKPLMVDVPEDKTMLAAAQALARMAISLDPNVAFKSTASSLVRPLVLLAKSSYPLGQFEALLALTNLGSLMDATVMTRIEQCNGTRVFEELQFSENDRIQGAATEALCNMVMFPDVMERYAKSKRGSARLRMNMALCGSDLENVRIAASGLLAMVTASSPEFARELAAEERAFPLILGLLGEKESVGLHLRGMEILKAWMAIPDVARELVCVQELHAILKRLMESGDTHPGLAAGLQDVFQCLVKLQQE